ncbi:hypothetical protein [Actinoplanes sp. NPDC023714]|uniref:hypothetical protein n=1 Tax=Actinoplanes sp. NPDC023714 TaxID=3154322 RepID=UPI0033C7DAA0
MPRARYRCGVLTDPAAIAAAKRLQGRAHLRYGHLPREALTAEGWLPWHDRAGGAPARWFGARSAGGRLVAVATKIARGGDGVVEASGAAKAAGTPPEVTLGLYRAMYHDSVDRGERLWVMNVVPPVRATLERFLEGGIVVSPAVVRARDLHPSVLPGVVVHPASGLVDGFTTRIRAAGDAAQDLSRRDLLYGVAAFFDDRPGR